MSIFTKNAQDFGDVEESRFIIISMDLSGIQDFIYTIHSKDALKTLRARSFYLEIMMEHMIDTLLERLSLSRANLLYAGGGHCYMILPNTAAVKDVCWQSSWVRPTSGLQKTMILHYMWQMAMPRHRRTI
ncbi:MAG: hypothetical protein ACLVH0_00415 [Coprococcus eutactus]